jgi:AraC-like DNA-binding protein
MNTIIIAGVAIGIFLLSLLLGKKPKLRADKFLIAYLTFFVVTQSYFYLEEYDFLQKSVWMLLGKGLYLLGGPLFFYYVYSITTSKAISVKLYFFTLLPFLIYAVHFLYHYWIGFDETTISIQNGVLYKNGEVPITWGFFTILFLLSDPFYLIWFFVLLKRYRLQTLESLSSVERINLNWLQSLFYVWAISAIILFPLMALSISGKWIPFFVLELLLQIAYVVFIFMVGYFGFKQTTVFRITEFDHENSRVTGKQVSYERSGLTGEQANVYHDQLLKLMEEQKPYLNGELNAKDLAQALRISPNHLSQVLNQKQEQNFFDFINSYRVLEFKRRVHKSQSRNLTLLAIALESGFNSKTSFNTTFKKITGKTPSQYYRSIDF